MNCNEFQWNKGDFVGLKLRLRSGTNTDKEQARAQPSRGVPNTIHQLVFGLVKGQIRVKVYCSQIG